MAIEPTRCAWVSHARLRAQLAADPALAMELVNLLIRRARIATRRAKGLALTNVYQRVARLLESLAESDGDGVRTVRERLSQQSIAERVGASRDMVRRVLNGLVAGDYLEIDGRTLRIRRRLPADW